MAFDCGRYLPVRTDLREAHYTLLLYTLLDELSIQRSFQGILRCHFGGVRDYLQGALGMSSSHFEGAGGSFEKENN